MDGSLRLEEEDCDWRAEIEAWHVNPYGFIRGVAVYFTEPIPNMDAANPLKIEIKISSFRNEHIKTVTALLSSVEEVEIAAEDGEESQARKGKVI